MNLFKHLFFLIFCSFSFTEAYALDVRKVEVDGLHLGTRASPEKVEEKLQEICMGAEVSGIPGWSGSTDYVCKSVFADQHKEIIVTAAFGHEGFLYSLSKSTFYTAGKGETFKSFQEDLSRRYGVSSLYRKEVYEEGVNHEYIWGSDCTKESEVPRVFYNSCSMNKPDLYIQVFEKNGIVYSKSLKLLGNGLSIKQAEVYQRLKTNRNNR